MTNESLNTHLAIVPYVSEIEHEHIQEPIVGMTFNSYEEVCQFYKEYGKQKGFGIVIKHSNRRSDGRCRRLVLCCYKAGKAPDESARPSSKTNCQAKIITRLLADGMLHLMEADNEHNHEMNPLQACSGIYREKVGTSGGRKRRKVNSVVENVNGHRENVGASSGMKRRNVNNVVGNVNGHKDENLSKIVINGREMKPIVKVAAICGSLHKASSNRGLLELAIQLSKESVCGLLIEYVDIASLPLLNIDLEVNGTHPPSVELFRQKILEADSILFASPECNYLLQDLFQTSSNVRNRGSGYKTSQTTAYDVIRRTKCIVNDCFLLFQKESTNILLYLIAIGQTTQPSSKHPFLIMIVYWLLMHVPSGNIKRGLLSEPSTCKWMNKWWYTCLCKFIIYG